MKYECHINECVRGYSAIKVTYIYWDVKGRKHTSHIGSMRMKSGGITIFSIAKENKRYVKIACNYGNSSI